MGPAENLAIDGDDATANLGERRHEPLKAGTKSDRIKTAEQPAEGVMARRAVLHVEEFTQEGLLGFGEQRHVHRPLAAAQYRAQGDRRKRVEVMKGRVSTSWVVGVVKTSDETIHRGLPR